MLNVCVGGREEPHCFEESKNRGHIFTLQMSVLLSSMTKFLIALSLPEEIELFFYDYLIKTNLVPYR